MPNFAQHDTNMLPKIHDRDKCFMCETSAKYKEGAISVSDAILSSRK